MDKTRDKVVEKGIRQIIGQTLIQLRRESNMSVEQFCERLGLSDSQYMELSQGEKIMNIPRFLQSIAVFGGWIEIHTESGSIDTREIYNVPAYSEAQAQANERERQRGLEQNRRRKETLKWIEDHTPSNQKSE